MLTTKSRLRWRASVIVGTLSLGVIAFLGLRTTTAPKATITIDPTEEYQTMTGWEVTARLWEIDKANDRYDGTWQLRKDEIFDRLVNELGINRIRIEIKSGAENPIDYWTLFRSGQIGYREYRRHFYEKINDDRDPNHINNSGFQLSALDYQVDNIALPLKRLLEARGEKLFINLTYVDFGQTELKGRLSHAKNAEEYAELIGVAFDHLHHRYDIVPDALEIVLEPDNSDDWRGHEIGVAMVAAAKRLRELGYFPQFIAPSTASARLAARYIDDLMAVPGAASLIFAFSYHRYEVGMAGSAPSSIAKRAKKFGVRTEMLEHVSGDAKELYDDLTEADASAWQQYGIATNKRGAKGDKGAYYYLFDEKAPKATAIKMAGRTPALANYFRFVRAGAMRVGAKSDNTAMKPVAFRNVDGRYVVVVGVDRSGVVAISGLPEGEYGIRFTTKGGQVREFPNVHATSKAMAHMTIPAEGTVTFYALTSPRSAAASAGRDGTLSP